jgi:hypothetical protein
MLRIQVRLALLTATALALACSDASALRYATPSPPGAANCLTAATACSLTTAITGSTTTGEEIVVAPGNYAVSSTIMPAASDLHIHGAAGQPRPVITGAASTAVFHGLSINLADLDIEGSGELLGISGGVLDRVFIRGNSGGNVLCQCYDGTIRNSVIVATGGLGAAGINSNGGNATETLINDTIISTAAGTPAIHLLQIGSTVSATIAYSATNVIARNLAVGYSVQVDQVKAAQSTVLTLHHSDLGTIAPPTNGASVVATDADLTTAPLFANAGAADFHELAGSPTINAGVADPQTGTLDFDSKTRAVGPIDIGAFEVQPPVVDPPMMPPVTTPVTPPAITDPTPPGPPIDPVSPPVLGGVPTAAPRLSITGRAFAVNASTARAQIRALCTAPQGGRCTVSGVLSSTQKLHGARHAKRVTVGSLRGTLTAGRRGTLTLRLTHGGLVALRPTATGRRRHLAVRLHAIVRAGALSRTLDTSLVISLIRTPSIHPKPAH